MKTYVVKTTWQVKGTGYSLTDTHMVKASSVKAAAAQALNGAYKKARRGWREAAGAFFSVQLTVLGPEIHIPEGREQS